MDSQDIQKPAAPSLCEGAETVASGLLLENGVRKTLACLRGHAGLSEKTAASILGISAARLLVFESDKPAYFQTIQNRPLHSAYKAKLTIQVRDKDQKIVIDRSLHVMDDAPSFEISLGSDLKEWRQKIGVGQRQIARAVGYDDRRCSHVENGGSIFSTPI